MESLLNWIVFFFFLLGFTFIFLSVGVKACERHILDRSHFLQNVTAVSAKNEPSACYRVLSISTSLFCVSHYILARGKCRVLTFNAAIELSYIHKASMSHPVIYFT